MDDIKQCEWFFSESPKNQDLGPNDAKFEIFKPDINSLVRESIQNSMDAVDDEECRSGYVLFNAILSQNSSS